MNSVGELDKYKEFTAWVSLFPALTLFLAIIISARYTFISEEIGSVLSIIFMMVALFLFIMSDKYVRKIVFSENLSEEEVSRLYKNAALMSGIVIPIIGLISALLVGYANAPITAFSFMIISLSGVGSAWKRFYDKISGKITFSSPEGAGQDKGKKRKKK